MSYIAGMGKAGFEIWTIGHSNYGLEQFLKLLQQHRIEAVADVRRFPGSRRHPQFSGDPLAGSLAAMRIRYEHFQELGGRRKAEPNSPNTAWRNASFRGYADYMATPAFISGVQRLSALAAASRTAIMCAEVLWWRCHRALIADYLKASGHRIWHIMGKGKAVEHPYTSAAVIEYGTLFYSASSAAKSAHGLK